MHPPRVVIDKNETVTPRQFAGQLVRVICQRRSSLRVAPQEIPPKAGRLRHSLLLPNAQTLLPVMNLLGRLGRISDQIVFSMPNPVLCRPHERT
eukprot:670092-Rhodomonas_salina.1